MSEKIIRDPVHDVIAFRLDRPLERLLFSLVNSAEFQRLRRIRQLGMANLAYPGADHTRYSHSLGVMETARKMLRRVGEFVEIEPELKALCLVGALLHDIGHGPLSHVFERVSGLDHEQVARRVILDDAGEVHRLLAEYDGQMPQKVADFLVGRPGRRFYNDILSSQLDADRFDYLLRDNLMTGSQYGGFDLGWLLQAITVDESADRLAVSAKGTSAVEDYLQSRYHMYRNVYFHKVVRSAEGMVRLALQRARRMAVQERLAWPPKESGVHKALLGQELSLAEFVELDDISMLMCFKEWMGGEDPVLAGLCRGLLFRRLFKVIDVSQMEEGAARAALAEAEELIREGGGETAYEIFYDQPSDSGYVPSGPRASAVLPEGGILIRDALGRTTDFAETSPLVGVLNRQLMFRRIHLAETWKPAVLKKIEWREARGG